MSTRVVMLTWHHGTMAMWPGLPGELHWVRLCSTEYQVSLVLLGMKSGR